MKLIKLVMPSQGDMEVYRQEGGVVYLKPTYFGGECSGPIVQFIDDPDDSLSPKGMEEGKSYAEPVVEASYRVRIKKDGDIRVARAD